MPADIHQLRRCSAKEGPIARFTTLGWICYGPMPEDTASHELTLLAGPESSNTEQLDRMGAKLWSLESVGMQTTQSHVSRDEKEAESLTALIISYDGERFQLGIPWKGGNKPDVQSNR